MFLVRPTFWAICFASNKVLRNSIEVLTRSLLRAFHRFVSCHLGPEEKKKENIMFLLLAGAQSYESCFFVRSQLDPTVIPLFPPPRTTVVATAAFLDAFQKVADLATNSRGKQTWGANWRGSFIFSGIFLLSINCVGSKTGRAVNISLKILKFCQKSTHIALDCWSTLFSLGSS